MRTGSHRQPFLTVGHAARRGKPPVLSKYSVSLSALADEYLDRTPSHAQFWK